MAVATTSSVRKFRRPRPASGHRSPTPVPDTSTPWRRATAALLIAVFVVMGLLSLGQRPAGYLSSDIGPKLATVDAMTATGSPRPLVGYWAAEEDPDGSLHPLRHSLTAAVSTGGERQYVVVTTLPMLMLAQPLYAVGGYRLLLVVPIVGALLAAAAAGALSRRLGSPNGLAATFSVGLASPILVYVTAFWEHSWGVALMAWGMIGLLDAACGRRWGRAPAWVVGLLAGVAFGVAAAMRQEALVVAAVAGVAVAVGTLRPGSSADVGLVAPTPGTGLRRLVLRLWAVPVGGGAMLALTAVVETRIIGDTIRVDRGLASLQTASTATERLSAAVITFASPSGGPAPVVMIVGLLFVGSLMALGRALDRGRDATRPAVVVACSYLIVVLNWMLNGTGFLSGLVVAAPLVGVGLGLRPTSSTGRIVRNTAIAALGWIMYFQYAIGAEPQWGGRYLLLPGLLLTVSAVTALERARRRALMVMLALSTLLTLAGAAWSIERSHAFERLGARLSADDRPLVFEDAFLPQEFGPVALAERWLVADSEGARSEAATLLIDADIEAFDYVGTGIEPEFVGFVPDDRVVVVEVIRADRLRVTTYVRQTP